MASSTARVRQLYARCRFMHQCPRCAKKPKLGQVYCPACQKDARERYKHRTRHQEKG